MPVTRRALAAFASVALVAPVAFALTAHAASPVSAISPGLTQVNLLNITDFHGRIGDKGALACTVENAKAALGEEKTLFIATGDNIGATPFVSSSQADEPTIKYLNALQLRTSAVGNHEFDRGFADLTGRVEALADFSYTGANVYQRGTTTPALKAYDVFTVNGVRVGVIGAVTQETSSLVSPAGIAGIDFGDPVAAVNRVAAQLTDGDDANGEADILVAQYHDGGANRGKILADTSAKVSVITMGHTHEVYVGTGDRAAIQSGQYGEVLGKVQLGYDAATKTVKEYVASVDKVAAPAGACLTDPEYLAARAVADEASKQAAIVGAQKVGEITADITTAHSGTTVVDGRYTGGKRDDRARESTLNNFTAEVWKSAMNVPGRPGADIGIMNPGGLRAELLYKDSGAPGDADGVVTLAEAAAVHPFANTMQTIDITGAQFKTLLEQQWQPASSSRPFLKLGLSYNVTYTYDPYLPEGNRITSIMYDGAPMDMAATFRVTAGSFLISGGDNFTVLQQGKNVKDTGLIDTDAFMNYFSGKGALSPNYAKHAVGVTPYPATLSTKEATNFKVQDLNMVSLGAPVNTTLTVALDGMNPVVVPVTDVEATDPVVTRTASDGTVTSFVLPPRRGEAEVSYTPAGAGSLLTLLADPSMTKALLPVKVTLPGSNGKAVGHCKNADKPGHVKNAGKPGHAKRGC